MKYIIKENDMSVLKENVLLNIDSGFSKKQHNFWKK